MAREPKGGRGAGAPPKYFTTHQVAQALGVSLPAVVNWTRLGRLQAHRTPGGHRRISLAELNRFAREHSYPLPADLVAQPEARPPCVVVADSDRDFGEMVRDYLEMKGFEVYVAEGAFSLGFVVGRARPRVVLLETGGPGLDGMAVARALRRDLHEEDVRIVAITAVPDPQVEQRVESGELDGAVRKPLKLDDLFELVRGVLERDRRGG